MTERRRSYKGLKIGGVLLVLVCVVVGVVVAVRNGGGGSDPRSGDEVGGGVMADDGEATKVVDDKRVEEKYEPAIKKEEVVQYEGNDPNKNDVITGAVTYAGVNGGELMVRVNIDQFLNGGECVMTIYDGGGAAVYEARAEVVDSAATSSCAGFNVPVGGIENGSYEVVIGVVSEGKKGEIRRTVEI